MEKTIVIIDGNEETGRIVSSFNLKAAIQQVFSGKEAKEFLSKHSPQIVILELQLPDMNGLDLLKEVPRICYTSNVIVYTQHATVEYAVKAMKQGVKDFITKDGSTVPLHNSIKHFLCNPVIHDYEDPVSLEEIERRHIIAVLCKNNGNRKRTAEELDISLRALYYKIKQYNIE